jgi:phosphate transport system substrate-binding protein
MTSTKEIIRMRSKWAAAVLVLGLVACTGDGKQYDDTATRGEITIAADESLQPLVDSEVMAFEGKNKYAKLNVLYKPDLESVNLMLNDSARLAIITRDLNATEREVFDRQKIKYRSYKIAEDAVALITHPSNRDTLITMSEIKAVFSGQKTKWSQLQGASLSEDIVIVFDNSNSSNLSFMVDKLGLKDKKQVPFYAVKSNRAVIEYVKKTPGAMGVIGINWISDVDDPTSKQDARMIRTLYIAEKENPTKVSEYLGPFAYNIATQQYPLRREVRIITKEARMGLGSGFVNFVTKNVGQLIVLKTGLLPANQPVRLVKIRPD